MSITARLLRGLEEAETLTRDITTRTAGDPSTNDFLSRLRFEEHLQGYDATELLWLMHDPKSNPDVRPELDRIMTALRSVVDQGIMHVETDNNTANRIAICRRPNDQGRERQLVVIKKSSLDNYLRIWKKIITYTMRVAIYQRGGTGAVQFTKAPPVRLTPEQLDTTIATMETTDMEVMESAVLALLDSLLRVELRSSDFDNVVTSAMAIMGLDQFGNGWKNAITFSYTTPLGATLYVARICLYEESWRTQTSEQDELGKFHPLESACLHFNRLRMRASRI